MSETEEPDPGYSERDDDDFSPATGDGVDPAELDLDELEDDDGGESEEDL
jgi:hypothetical protein